MYVIITDIIGNEMAHLLVAMVMILHRQIPLYSAYLTDSKLGMHLLVAMVMILYRQIPLYSAYLTDSK